MDLSWMDVAKICVLMVMFMVVVCIAADALTRRD